MSVAKKLVMVAENVPKVYEAGQKAEYDKFWDLYQENGNKYAYYYAFAGLSWDNETFKPKYDIKPQFSSISTFTYSQIVDLKGLLESLGVKLDTSKASNLSSFFSYSKVTRVPVIDCSTAVSVAGIFSECTNLQYVEKLILTKKLEYSSSMFQNCKNLEHMIVEGVIGRKGFNVSPCTKLTKESLLSILKALSLDITETTTITFSTEHQATIESDAECLEQLSLAVNAGWTIAYA